MRLEESAKAEQGAQFNIEFVMDLSQFDELERRVVGVIERLEKLKTENAELHTQMTALQEQFQLKVAESEQLAVQKEELLHSQRDEQKEQLIRQKVESLLAKLDGL